MKANLKIITGILAAIFILNFTIPALAYRIEIIPDNPKQALSIKLNEEAVFTAKAYASKKKGAAEDKEVPIEKIFWQFDYNFLEKIYSDKQSIKIRAIKEGKIKLTVTGIVGNSPFTSSIELTIEE